MAIEKRVETGATSFNITYGLSDGCTGDVTFSKDADWLTLGTKTSTAQCVDVATNTSGERVGHITPSYNGSSCSDKVITVRQEGVSVDLCSSVGCSGCGAAKGADATSHSISWSIGGGSISNLSVSNSSTTLSNLSITVNSSSINFTFDENSDTTNSKSFTANASFTVTSGGVTTSCTVNNFGFTQNAASVTCDCTITGGSNSLTWQSSEYGVGKKLLAFTYPSGEVCDPVTPTVTLNGPFSSAQTSNQIYVYPNAENTSTTDDNTGTITLSVSCSSSGDSKTINLKQNKNACDCDSIGLGTTSVTINAGSDTDVTITPGCTTLGGVNVADTTIAEATLDTTDNKITIVGKKSGTTTVTLSYTAGTTDCSKTIDVTVECPNYTIKPTGGSGTGGTITFSATAS